MAPRRHFDPLSRWPDAVICAVFLGVAALSRLPVLTRSVLDWDESLYLIMAGQWRAGHLPYSTIWDNKPIGIYAIFAGFEAVFGERVAAIRIASTLCAGLSAFLVYLITRQLTRMRGAALFAGASFLICGLSNDGLAANTEPFMACGTAIGVAIAGSTTLRRWPLRQAWLAGLAVGGAFMIKYVSVLEAPAVFLLLLCSVGRPWRPRLGLAIAFAAAAAVPLALTILLYWQAGSLPLWWACAVAANFRRAGAAVTAGALGYAARIELLRWGPLFLAAAVVLVVGFKRLWRREPAGPTLFLAIWLVGGGLGVAAAKSFYDHYFLQILPVLCVCLGWCAARLAGSLGRRRAVLMLCGAAVLAQPTLAAAVALRAGAAPVLSAAGLRPDVPARIARDLAAPLAAAAGGLYVFDSEPILYVLTHQTPPTRYAFPSVLTTRFLARVAGVDAVAEVTRILAGRPAFIVRDARPRRGQNPIDPRIYALMDASLSAHYRLWDAYGGINVFERKSGF